MKKLLAGMIAAALGAVAIKKAVGIQKAEWTGLTESEARAKLEAKLPSRMPEDKRAEITDKAVAKMREQGLVTEDDPAEGSDESEEIDLRESSSVSPGANA